MATIPQAGPSWPGGSKPAASALPRRAFGLLWLLALLTHLALALPFLHYPIALDDMFQYDMLARSLAAGQGYRWYARADFETLRPYLEGFLDLTGVQPPENGLATTHRAPGYPLFLALLYCFSSPASHFVVARLAQVLLASLMAPAVAALALKMGLSRRAAVLAALGMAFYPLLLLYPSALASENVFIPLLLAGTLALLWAAASASVWRCALAGLVVGLAMLTRSIVMPFAVLGTLWLGRYGQASWRGASLALITAVAVCVPWAVRNTLVMKRPAFVETSLGYNLFVANHPQSNGGFVSEVAILPLSMFDDAERDRYCTQQALSFIRADPVEALRRAALRAVYFVALEDRELAFFYGNGFFGPIPQPWLTLAYLLVVVPWVVLVPLALVGMALAPRRPVWLVLALVAGYALPHLAVIAEPRFHLVLVPVLLPLAACGWVERRRLPEMLASRRAAAWLACAAAIVFLALVAWGVALRWGQLSALLGPEGHKLYLSY